MQYHAMPTSQGSELDQSVFSFCSPRPNRTCEFLQRAQCCGRFSCAPSIWDPVFDIRSREHSICPSGALTSKNLNIRPWISVALVVFNGGWRIWGLRKSVVFVFQVWAHACSLETFWCYSSPPSDLESMAEGFWRRFKSHCLIERWHAIVEE